MLRRLDPASLRQAVDFFLAHTRLVHSRATSGQVRIDNIATLNRTVQHFKDNGVDLDATPISMGQLLQFDPQKEVFTNSADANTDTFAGPPA